MLEQPSPFETVFCPRCLTLMWESEVCPNGDWKRPEIGGKPGTQVWRRTLEGEIGKPYLTLASAGQLLLVAIEKGQQRDGRYSELVALDMQTGLTRWTHSLAPNRFARFLTMIGSLLISSSEHLGVLAGSQCLVQALDVDKGEAVWQTELPAHSHGAPAVLGSMLLISASDHRVYALNEADGAIAWQSGVLPNWSPAPPTIGDNAVFIGGFTHEISRLAADGMNTTLFRNQKETDWFEIPFAYGDGMLFAPSSDRQLHAIDASNGELCWTQPADRGVSAPAVVGEKRIFVPIKARPSGRYVLRALDLAGGETRWEFAARKHILAPPLLHEGSLYFGSRGGMFYALDAATGDLLWEVEIGEAVRSTATINGSYIFFGTAAGSIHCARWRAEIEEPLLPADSYRADGEWLLAGTAAARDGQWRDAAADFERGAHPAVAAQLYERADAWELAAPLYAQSNHFQRALHAYEQAGDRRHAAEMHLHLRQPELAAELFAGLGDHARAAEIYDESGHLKRAALQYAEAGDTEQAILLYLALKQPESAAQLAAETGDIDRAVVIWSEIDNFERAAALLVAAERRDEGAALLEDNGLIRPAAGLWVEVGEMAKAAEVYERAQMWVEAARCYEETGLVIKAAQAYFLAGEVRRAADLYLAAGRVQKALNIFIQLQSYNAIAKIHKQQEQWQKAGQAYLAAKPPRYEKAARCFVEVQAWAQAAQAFQEAGLIDDAIDCWRKSETPRRAAELLREQGRQAEAAALYAEIGNLQDAAEIELDMGHIEEAVAHYRQLGNEERAVEVARSYQRWDIISNLAREKGEFEQEAEAALALARQSPGQDYLHFRAAAQAYARAAQQHEARENRVISDEAIACLWELAARYFDQGMIEDKQLIDQSRREARRMRGWPEIVLDVQAERKLAIERWDGLIVHIKNIGYGVARHVSVKVIAGEFEGKLDTQTFSGILPGRTEQIRLNVRPRSAGSSVPLYIRLSYTRPDHQEMERDINTEVPVHDHGSKSATSESGIRRRTPIKLHRDEDYDDDERRKQTIIVQGDYITVGNVSDATAAISESSSAAATGLAPPQAAEPSPTQDLSSTGVAAGRDETASIVRSGCGVSGRTGAGDLDLDVRDLYQRLVTQFNIEELRNLSFVLGIDYEDLGGLGKSGIARELVLYMQRRDGLDDLNRAIQERRG